MGTAMLTLSMTTGVPSTTRTRAMLKRPMSLYILVTTFLLMITQAVTRGGVGQTLAQAFQDNIAGVAPLTQTVSTTYLTLRSTTERKWRSQTISTSRMENQPHMTLVGTPTM